MKFFQPTKLKVNLTIFLLALAIINIVALTKTYNELLLLTSGILSYPVVFLMNLLLPEGVNSYINSYFTSFLVWSLFFFLNILYLYIISSILVFIYNGFKKQEKNARRPKRKKKVKKRQKRKKKV